ncbi:MAG: Hsp33 family molecular chaperone HslO [Rickettsiales bacterium]
MVTPHLSLLKHEDLVQPFLLHDSTVRGRMTRLSPTIDTILNRHENHPLVNKLLGEMLTLSALLSSSLPEEGILTMQAKGDGPVEFIIVDAVHGGGLRGYARTKENANDMLDAVQEENPHPDLPTLMGKGYLAITLDMGIGDPYQGIVPLEGKSLTDAVQHYFSQSQQINVMFNVHVNRRIDKEGHASWASGGIMLERLPEEGGKPSKKVISTAELHDREHWAYHELLANTASEDELLDPHLAPSALLYRLFNEGGVWVHEPKQVSPTCRCSRDKISNILLSMDDETLEELAVEGVISVTCEFCNKEEDFKTEELLKKEKD